MLTTHGHSVLPDSRCERKRVTKQMIWPGHGVIEVEAVYCASCSKTHGWVPCANTTFACWLCEACAEKYGANIPGYLMPDEVYWEAIRLETGGLTLKKVRELLESTTSLLSKLVRLQPKGRN